VVSENLDAIVSLATSKLNSTTERFQSQLRQQLKKFDKVLQKVDLGDVKAEKKRVEDLAMLDEREIQEVQSFVSALIDSKKNKLEVEVDNGVEDDDVRRRRKRL